MATTYPVNDCLSGLQTKLAELVAASVVREVVERPVNPLTENNTPIIGMLAHRYDRRGGPVAERDWVVDVEMALVTRRGDIAAAGGDSIHTMVGQVNAKLEAWEATDGPGGVIENYRINVWYHAKARNPEVPVGAVFSFELRLEGPLKQTS
ncbi:MAG TPA: hypothetical protein VMW48_08785 [Vicinamibacterales bacterium]|nr:hypothetical protein [Vicinamibacterales bacterium]